jgi:hypothetical protein
MLLFQNEKKAVGLVPNAIGAVGPYKTEECKLVRDCWKAVDERGGRGGGQNSLSEVD